MANKNLNSLTFPDLSDTYVVNQIAEEYDSTAVYAVGDYCNYLGQVYRCTEAITAAEAWTAAHWTAVYLADDVADIQSALDASEAARLAMYPTDTASGAIASFPDGAEDVPVKALTVNIEPVQSGSGDPSPTNVRPISGWTQAKVTRTGVNVWNEDYALGFWNSSGAWVANTDGYMSNKTLIPVLPSTTYCITIGKQTSFYLGFYDGNRNFLERKTLAYTLANRVFTTPSNCHYISFSTYPAYGTTYSNDISINYPSTDTGYHPYTGDTLSIDWTDEASTVCGGTLDVTSGTLTVDRVLWTKNTADMDNSENYPGWKNSGLSALGYSGNGSATSVMMNVGSQFSYNTNNGDVLFLGVGRYEKTQTEWKALAIDVQIAVPIPNPITYQLTPQEVATLLGSNNIWADCGDVSVTYRADIAKYIQKKISEAAT